MTTATLQPKFERVMIIDDNSIDLYITSRMIEKKKIGKNVLKYLTAGEALKYLQENQDSISELPQVIFVDIYMPTMSGFEFLEAYDKLSPALKRYCKVFVVSSTIDKGDMARIRSDKNVVSFQVKPVTNEFFNQLIAG